MIVYLGDTRSQALLAEIRTRKAGTMVVRGRLRSRLKAWRWAYDNGAWTDYKKGRAFDELTFGRDLDEIAKLSTREAPDFCVLPDIVAGGRRSLDLSLSWLGRVRGAHWNWFLPVQDGMTADDLPATWGDWLGGIFVGGLTPWKLRTARYWRMESAKRGLLCHVGRVGTRLRVRHMRAIGIGSIDSTMPLWSRDKWRLFWNEIDTRQIPLYPEGLGAR